MATIIKRKKTYSVVYNYEDEKGETRQKWETWHTHKDALKRKAEIENHQFNGTFITPKEQTVEEYLYDFVSLYGEKNWGVSTYDGNTGLIANYINPIIGHVKIQDITTQFVDKYYKQLQKYPAASSSRRKATTQYVASGAIEKIFKLLRCAFRQAVKWDLIGKNPFEHFDLPKRKYKPREIWDADMIKTALDNCEDTKLYIALNLAFACSLRMGEILGLSWENVHISDDDIARDDAYVYIDKELERASQRSIEMLEKKDIYFIFPTLYPNTSTQLVLKKPKTDSSIRKVWLPKTKTQ